MTNNSVMEMLPGDVRDREVIPGVFVPMPDSDQAVKEDAEQQLREQTGSGDGEPDENCDRAIEEGLNMETINSFEGVRQWVMCNAWRKSRQQDLSFGEAVQASWDEVAQARSDMRN